MFKLGVVIAAWAVLLASCSGEGGDASSTSVSLSTVAPVSSTTVARPVFGSLDELVEHRYAGGLDAVIVGVFEDSSPHVAAIGEDGDGVAVDADRPWYTASLAKVFTAATVLQLVDDGSIDLDGPIADYVDFPVSDQITVRHLLGHKSSIRDVMPVQCSGQARLEKVIEFAGLATEPSDTTDYSGSNYVLLGLLIGSVTGQDPGDYIRDEVFTPLGMTSTYWYESQTGPRPWFRSSESVDGSESYACGEPGPTIGTDGAAITTLADVDAFYRGLFNGAILEADTLAAMLEMNGELFGDGYGLGIGEITNDAFPDERLYGFGGEGGFFGTMAFHDPDKKRTVAMFFTQGHRLNMFWDLVAWANNQNSG
jgi:D-alanyl-D-alanine carboxypeptidase